MQTQRDRTRGDPHPRLARALSALVDRMRTGERVFGEKLLVLGSGPLPVPNSPGAAVALDRDGAVVLIVALPAVVSSSVEAIERQLDRIAQIPPAQLKRLQDRSTAEQDVARRHASFFRLQPGAVALNDRQKVIVVTERPPLRLAGESLSAVLDDRLSGVYLWSDGSLAPLLPAPQERPRQAAALERLPRWADVRSWLPVVAVVGAVALLVASALDGEPATTEMRDELLVESPVSDVAPAASTRATYSNLIGQRRVVRSSSGALVSVGATTDGFFVVSDERNQGRSWEEPITIPTLGSPSSFAVAIDADDDLHVALVDGNGVSYASLHRSRGIWTSGPVVTLDGTSSSPVVDIAWDGRSGAAHVVWVRETLAGDQPAWAAISGSAKTARLLGSLVLAKPGKQADVLVNVTYTGTSVVATYRSGRSPTGWFARAARRKGEVFDWGAQERVPTESAIGAATLASRGDGIAHLVLADDRGSELVYYQRTARGRWSEGEIVVEDQPTARSPSLTADVSSDVLYLFYEVERDLPEVLVSIRDPAAGWEGPYRLVPPAEAGDGAAYPTSIERARGQGIVLWTSGGASPAIQVARVTPP